jgi:methylmalonyl-CoA epimerase
MIRKIDHIGIAVRDLKDGARFWTEGLGLEVAGTETVESEQVDVLFLPAGESRLELLQPTDGGSPIARFIEKRGEGIHHLTLAVDDIEQTLERLEDAGVDVLGDAPRPGAGGSRVAFLHPRSCGGVLVELVEHPRRKRGEWDIAPGHPVLAYLREPQEKVWGVLRRLDPAGIVVEGIDLGSFDDWVAQIERDEESVVGPSVLFVPMSRLEKLLLDRPSGHLPSLAERFFRRTGRNVQDVLEDDPGGTEY